MTEDPEPQGHRWFAAFYDLIMRPGEKRLGDRRRRLLQDVAGDVVEIGAGTGANFEHYPAAARVVALEPDPHMLTRARKRLETLNHPSIDIRLAPAERLPLADASVDVVVSTLVLCSVRDLAQTLAEVRRVLRPGGEFRFIEHVRGGGMLGRAQDVIQPAWGWCSAGCHINRRTAEALEAAGFELGDVESRKMAPWMPAIIGRARVAAAGPG